MPQYCVVALDRLAYIVVYTFYELRNAYNFVRQNSDKLGILSVAQWDDAAICYADIPDWRNHLSDY